MEIEGRDGSVSEKIGRERRERTTEVRGEIKSVKERKEEKRRREDKRKVRGEGSSGGQRREKLKTDRER